MLNFFFVQRLFNRAVLESSESVRWGHTATLFLGRDLVSESLPALTKMLTIRQMEKEH